MMKKSLFVKYLYYLTILIFEYVKSEDAENNLSNDKKDTSKSIFEQHLIVPHLLPSVPKEICSVFYKPGLIIISGQPYFPYQIQDLPEITWNFKSEKFYTVVVLGAFNREPSQQNTIEKHSKDELIPPENSWYQWMIVNIRKNNLHSGTVLQPYVDNFWPNETHKIVYTFAVFEQFKKFELTLDGEQNSTQTLLQRYFTPISNIIKSFGGSFLLAGNFFYVAPKSSSMYRDSSPVRYNLQRELMSIMKPDHYVGL